MRGHWTTHHGDLIAGVKTRAGLAVLVDLVRQNGAVRHSETEVEEEVRDAGEEADADHPLGTRLRRAGREAALPPAPWPLASGFTTMERTSAR